MPLDPVELCLPPFDFRQPPVGAQALDVRAHRVDDRVKYLIACLDAVLVAEDLDSSCLLGRRRAIAA
jgi:hypothetical protein